MTLEERRKIIKNTFTTHEGKLCLKILVEDFQECRLYDESDSRMAYRVGQYELVQYLKDMTKGNSDE